MLPMQTTRASLFASARSFIAATGCEIDAAPKLLILSKPSVVH